MEFTEDTVFNLEQLPPFASDYNKQLDQEIKQKEKNILQIEAELEINRQRNERMKEHLKKVEAEIQNTQFLSGAKQREVETEAHLKQLAERETGRIKIDIEKLKGKTMALSEKNHIFKTTSRLEKYEDLLEMKKDQLAQWAEARKQKEDDNLVLERYTRSDDVRIKDLNLQIEKLSKALRLRQQELDREVTETRAGQIELDKTGEEFRKLHKERQDLLVQWEETIKAMERRDVMIEQAAHIHAQLQAEREDKKKAISEKLKFLESQQENNKDVEAKIAAADRTLTRLRGDYGTAQGSIAGYTDELETIKNTLRAAVNNLDVKKAEIQHFKKEIELKKRRIETAKTVRDKTKHNLEVHYQHTDDLGERAKQLDMYYKKKEGKLSKAEKEQRDLKQQIFKESQDLFKLGQEEQTLLSELSGAKAAERNLQAKILKLDTESLKQQELVYNQEYQLQQLERKISRVQGERSNEEKQILTAKIKELSAQLDKQDEEKKLLTDQLKKIGDDVRGAKRKLESLKIEKQQMAISINELNLQNESSQRALRAVAHRKEEVLVAENFVRLDVKRLRDLLYMRADEVYGLETRKIQLKMSMEERKQEITVHKEVLRAHVRTTEEERHKRAKELAEKLTRIDKLKRKYQVLMLQLSPEGDEEEHSQSYYIIKSAQQKEELKKEAAALQLQITKMEKDIQGLENSLTAFNALNHRLHAVKTRGGMTSKDMEESTFIEGKYNSVREEHQSVTSKAAKIQNEVAELESKMEELSMNSSQRDMTLQQLNYQKSQLEKEIEQLKMKLQRAWNQVQKISKQYKNKRKLPDDEESFIDKDLRMQEMKQTNTWTLYNIAQLTQQYPGLAMRVLSLAESAGLQLPSRPPSVSSTANNSPIGSPGASVPGTPDGKNRPSSTHSTPRGPLSTKSVSVSFSRSPSTNVTSRPTSRASVKTPVREGRTVTPSTVSFGLNGAPIGLPKISSRTSSPSTTPPLSPNGRQAAAQILPASRTLVSSGSVKSRN